MAVVRAIETFLGRAARTGDRPAFVEAATGERIGYDALMAQIERCGARLAKAGIGPGHSVILLGDFGAASAAWLMALWQAGAVVAPVLPTDPERSANFADIAQARFIVDIAADTVSPGPGSSDHPLLQSLAESGAGGLIIFTSGTTGQPKAALHDLRRLLRKFEGPGKDFTTLAFLLFDHIAGIDTLLYCLSNGATIICPDERAPARIVDLLETHQVEVLPTAPSFLNLLMLSGATEGRDLSALKIITYGAEMMPQPLLERLANAFPNARLIQKYGTSEAGAPKSRSEGNTSRWLDLGVEDTDWRIRDGRLELPGDRAMLGYLNAPSPFAADGWYQTGDRVERRGDTVRILGRASDMINVGGEKVFPAEVEAAICEVEGIAEAAVSGRPHPLMGSVIMARVRPTDPDATAPEIRQALRQALTGTLEPYKIPQKIEVTHEPLTTARFKAKR